METVRFDELDLYPQVLRAIADMGFEEATPIQSQAIPVVMSGVDVIGQAQTGTGKTASFGIPVLHKVDPNSRKTQVIILSPTRELAIQVADEIRKLAKYMHGVKVLPVYGGQEIGRQIKALKGGAQIIVGTPGRVMDHLRRKTIRCDAIHTVVLDEADEMLNMGFRDDIETILEYIPAEGRQTILFSATMPKPILDITRKYQHDAVNIKVVKKELTVPSIEQYYYDVKRSDKVEVLTRLLDYYNPKLSLVFCNTKRMVDELAEELKGRGYFAEGLHGDMKQSQRDRVMKGFRSGKTEILIATDVAARGIDVDDVEAVFNYDIPQSTEYYVHRIGRTGRAGKSGKAITLCSGRRQVGELLQIGRLVKAGIERAALPTPAQIRERGQERLLSEMAEALAQPEENAPFSRAVETLAGQGYPPEAIAAAALRLAAGEGETDLEEIPPSPAYRPDAPHGGYRKICINIGREKNVAPNHIVAAIAGRTGMQGRDIGKIEIYDDETIVAIPAARFDDTLEAMAGCKIVGTPTETRAFTGGVSFPAEASRSAGHGGKDYRRLPKRRGAEGRGRKPR